MATDGEHQVKVLTLKNAVIFLLSILSIISSVYTHNHFVGDGFFGSEVVPVLFSELGVAGLIAIALIYTVEKHNKDLERQEHKRMVDAVEKNVLESIYKRYIPPKVFDEVDKCLFRASLFRTKLKVHYTIQRVDRKLDESIDKPSHVTCDAYISYHLKNVTQKERTENVPIYIERPYDANWNDKVGVKSLVIIRCVNGERKAFDQSQIDKYIDNSDDKQIIFKYPVNFQPDEEICVEARFTLIKRLVDQEIWVSRIPTECMELTVTTPDADFEVLAKACHTEALGENLDPDHITSYWTLDYGVLPHQSVIFWWKPIEKQ